MVGSKSTRLRSAGSECTCLRSAGSKFTRLRGWLSFQIHSAQRRLAGSKATRLRLAELANNSVDRLAELQFTG